MAYVNLTSTKVVSFRLVIALQLFQFHEACGVKTPNQSIKGNFI